MKRVSELDYDHKFKYDYKVDAVTMINDPLEASSFFEENHICNKGTIAKAECRLSASTGSYIKFVNNR
jgi:hypothetical protein